ncbi:hypothetical protein BH11VER1_BH11VER1_24670 [soil metagenome]
MELSPSFLLRATPKRPLAWLFLLFTFYFSLLTPSPAQSPIPPISADKAAKDGQVWGALVYASNTAPEIKTVAEPTPDFPDLAKRLGKVFNYSHFQVLGQHTQIVFREYESWVVPSRDVFLKLDSKGAAKDGGLNLHLQFWQGQQVLVKSDAVLRSESPLFIGGPKWREGQIIFVLLLKKVDGK